MPVLPRLSSDYAFLPRVVTLWQHCGRDRFRGLRARPDSHSEFKIGARRAEIARCRSRGETRKDAGGGRRPSISRRA